MDTTMITKQRKVIPLKDLIHQGLIEDLCDISYVNKVNKTITAEAVVITGIVKGRITYSMITQDPGTGDDTISSITINLETNRIKKINFKYDRQ